MTNQIPFFRRAEAKKWHYGSPSDRIQPNNIKKEKAMKKVEKLQEKINNHNLKMAKSNKFKVWSHINYKIKKKRMINGAFDPFRWWMKSVGYLSLLNTNGRAKDAWRITAILHTRLYGIFNLLNFSSSILKQWVHIVDVFLKYVDGLFSK